MGAVLPNICQKFIKDKKVIWNTDPRCKIWKGPFCETVVWSGPTAPSTLSEGEVSSLQPCTEDSALGFERRSQVS